MRVLLVDDETLCLEVLVGLLHEKFGQVEVIIVSTIAEALGQLEQMAPDLILADLAASDVLARPGIEEIVRCSAGVPVLTLDRRPVTLHCSRARAAGARGYVAKTSSRELMGAVISLMCAGGEFFPQIDVAPQQPRWRDRLSARQAQVLDLLAEGQTNALIARSLGIAIPTVKLHVQSLMRAAEAQPCRSRVEGQGDGRRGMTQFRSSQRAIGAVPDPVRSGNDI